MLKRKKNRKIAILLNHFLARRLSLSLSLQSVLFRFPGSLKSSPSETPHPALHTPHITNTKSFLSNIHRRGWGICRIMRIKHCHLHKFMRFLAFPTGYTGNNAQKVKATFHTRNSYLKLYIYIYIGVPLCRCCIPLFPHIP